MRVHRRTLLLTLVVTCLGPAGVQAQPVSQAARDSAWHVLNRVGFGPLPGQVEQVAREGVLVWVDRQLAMEGAGHPGLRPLEQQFTLLQLDHDDRVRAYTESVQARVRAQRQTPGREVGQRPGTMDDAVRTQRRLSAEFPQVALVRALTSENQLGEVLADFWFNHFNVFAGKATVRALAPGYVEDGIRPHVLGRFEDLLLAVARSPAMLVYLDNAQSVTPGSRPPELARLDRAARGRTGRNQRARRDSARARIEARLPTGINENYARELLELHTLGVDGGYTQDDVVNVARILTGWSVTRPAEGSRFVFHEWAHDRGEKVVLGQRFPAGRGEEEGRDLLRFLANHPATMHHVSSRLCGRFVQDTPPDGCVDDAVRAWRRTDGDLREVTRAILQGPDFWAPSTAGSKVKTPLEFLVSALRALGATPDTSLALAQVVTRLGQPLYLQAVPTGYPESQEEWVSSSALFDRMNIAVTLAAGRLPGATVNLDGILPEALTRDHAALAAQLDTLLLGGRMSEQTRRTLVDELRDIRDPAAARTLAVGLTLGGPEFQRQ